jgi:tocopherol cyclase
LKIRSTKDKTIENPIKLWRPTVFQGRGKEAPYFEGWFYKIVDQSGAHTLAFIPGLYIGKEQKDSHAFVMILDAETHSCSYHVYPVEEFHASTKSLDIRVGRNRFRHDYFELDIESSGRTVKGRIEMGKWTPWPVQLFSPGVMGWYAFMPFMECFHAVLSFDHAVGGTLEINGRTIDFNGRGYVEKDWGKSFPSAYVWMQSNHFSTVGLSVMASVANIPWLGSSFRGFIVGVWMDSRLLRFTTYTGARLAYCRIDNTHISLKVEDRRHELLLCAERTQGGTLYAPYDVSMTPKVSETLGSSIELELYRKQGRGRGLLITDKGRNAGLDVNGRLEEIIF